MSTHRPAIRLVAAALFTFLAGAASASHSIAPPKPTAEIVQVHEDAGNIRFAMWFPNTMFGDPSMGLTPEQGRKVTAMLDGYLFVGVGSAHMDKVKLDLVANDREALRASLRLQAGDGPPLAALTDAELPKTVRALRDAMGPMMGRLMGQFGDAMLIAVFRDADEHGHSTLDPRKPGAVTISFAADTFRWNLPMSSLQPLRVDADTGDTFPGDYDFSPFTGHKLVVKP